jgi:SNF2 family DNA or RNA helicase
LITEVDVSRDTWQGSYAPEHAVKFDKWATTDEGSLFWMFNKLPSPSPSVDKVKEKYAREALEDLLDPVSLIPGLKTQLYPYQRRSAGLMLQRESISTLELDPRLERRVTPDGSTFYYSARDLIFLRHPRYYEACKGGVLAETMGLGKTLICLALILATKDHNPKIPPPYDMPPTRRSTASLADMAISAINRKSIPWRVEFERIRHATGDEMISCRARIDNVPASYEIPVEPLRWNRKTILPPPKTMLLAPTTLIVVPRNLCKQWQSEIRKHVEEGMLRVLIMEDSKMPLPAPDQLCMYDIILFTRGRFEMEVKDGADEQGRRLGDSTRVCRCTYIGATRTRDCHCIRRDELYDSPLKHLHFKRLIIDEGHFFSNTNNTAVSVANKLVTADHRWVVSGTPAKDLLGVEVDMAAAENLWHTPDTKDSRETALEQRRYFSKKDDTNGAIKSLGSLASNFLRIKPWCPFDAGERRAEWEEYIYRHGDFRKRTFSGFSTCLRRILESMVVKTQPEDVERDIDLPPLSHEVIRLQPSLYDKLTANLFTLVLTANAVTSERTDVDYLFHKNSQKARSQLISNLRQSAFFWTGFSEADVLASLKSSNAYLDKDGTGCSMADRELLTRTLSFADIVLDSTGWKALSRSHEVGIFIHDWPSESADHWSFDESRMPLLTGVSQLLDAQKFINEHADEDDPSEGFAGAGIRALAPAKHGSSKKDEEDKQPTDRPILVKSGIPTSSIDGEPVLKRRGSSSFKGSKISPKKSSFGSKQHSAKKPQSKNESRESGHAQISVAKNRNDRRPVVPDNQDDFKELPEDSPFLKARIVGTTSAKLSYLISQILKYYQHEKILVFYDGDNVAYYIAQMLELLHIKHEIYAKSLAAHLKSEYVVRFDQEAQDRVLLMDVRNAAFGLNLPSASRIYFVNPVCRPNIEAQAIKRAHRIGQSRKVFVETLVLKETIEEKASSSPSQIRERDVSKLTLLFQMLERSKRMTRSEHREANHLEDDGDIRQIIQSAQMLPISAKERIGYGQVAPLEEQQQLWNRTGWKQFSGFYKNPMSEGIPKKRKLDSGTLDGATDGDDHTNRRKKLAMRTLAFVDCRASGSIDRGSFEMVGSEDSDDDEPMLARFRRTSTTAASNIPHHPSLNMKSDDPYMPSMGYSLADNSLSNGSYVNLTGSSAVDGSIPPSPSYRRLSISQLLNEDQTTKQSLESDQRELLREILRRL